MNLSFNRVAGLSMKGGRRDNFFFCLLDHHEGSGRWFLKSILHVKDEVRDEDAQDGDEILNQWIDKYNLEHVIIDFPLSKPPCHNCDLKCPGVAKCPVGDVKKVREDIASILEMDRKMEEENPKEYERKRNFEDLTHFDRDTFGKDSNDFMLSKSFKRRLKKGFIPYWNRSLDFWIWCSYHDQLLELFNTTFDSFGNTSLMMLSRFSYMKRHFPQECQFYEGHVNLILLELLKSRIILKKNIVNLTDLDLGVEARLDIVKKIENKLGIFIYDNDLEVIVKNVRAFDSFLLAVCGLQKAKGQARSMPDWTLPHLTNFILPSFDSRA
ncbi:hypothetical protein [Halobacteriovorax sp. ZH5_bin.2]|uniref:hypothetical protein n=1 Tax=Halobacteriovorax sp. ZH5_bin.2 TaxID=3157727 RepID=UPI00371F031E